ncbi:DUF4363 family protein [Clostridium luticellarii]|uniref:DUF4363 domain-containing protein n=1 Tax=Clostridium luticellarii TaxID=1691940 RepID=A0A2T0BQJ5_9CLOT|nr:DUF4363 family protein [Clostridium luticellarii]MCI1944781.1 DUF4363 family protein [Clostridium luticellarii]MCI1968276.1 DUF4363 family protein [Clostridium luticellarii]MCI1995687.1 DUF4363 family protein [Clostridium luticellarii]MCI2040233.1 DUF4363 family protein [Clostridium luticellarii]PRR86151.1 hypothetical protein CLLU_08000 [Clostridium luticellarii]
MKSTIISFSIFVLMLFCIIFSINYLNTICTKLQDSNIKVEKSIQSSSWKEAYENSQNFMEEWEKYYPKLSIFSDHNEIEDISNESQKLLQHIKHKNSEESLSSANVIQNSLKHIREMQQLNIQNLF